MEVTCPNCGQVGESDIEPAVGQHVLCPFCNEKFVYDRPTLAVSPTQKERRQQVPTRKKITIRREQSLQPRRVYVTMPSRFAHPRSAVASVSAATSETISEKCPYCGIAYDVGVEWFGKTIVCETCGNNFTVGLNLTQHMSSAVVGSKFHKTATTQQIENSVMKRIFLLHGRASRKEFWITQLCITLFLLVPLVMICHEISPDSADFEGAVGILSVISVILITPVSIRRLHDMNLSGWFLLVLYLLFLIPIKVTDYLGVFILGIQKGTKGDNAFGSDPLAKD